VALVMQFRSGGRPPEAPRSWGDPSPQTPLATPLGISPTLAANEALEARRRRGQPVLPMAFGEAGLPAHPLLREALADATGCTAYGPVAGHAALREAAAAWWTRRGLLTDAAAVVAGPGSKALLFALIAAVGGDVAVTRPSWVSYGAQASLAGRTTHFVPGSGGVPDAAKLARTVGVARASGRPVRAVIVTLPDNPTGTQASAGAVRALCSVAERHGLIIISDEIYRDLVHDNVADITSPATISAERTVVTSGLSKNLALGGWRLGVARLPHGRLGRELRTRLLGIGSEVWSAPAGPVQEAAALAYREPAPLAERIALSRRLHGRVAREVAFRFASAGASVPPPQAAFYVYPDFGPLGEVLRHRHGITTDEGLTGLLLRRYGLGVLPGSAFGEQPWRLRFRVATGMLYGETDEQRNAALTAADPCALPWIAAALDRLEEILTDLTR
jgi:aspartate/methionine/tyrosine aminotransferase